MLNGLSEQVMRCYRSSGGCSFEFDERIGIAFPVVAVLEMAGAGFDRLSLSEFIRRGVYHARLTQQALGQQARAAASQGPAQCALPDVDPQA